MTASELVLSYVPIARFIALVCGADCEVVLHDLSDIEHSIVFIGNGHITGRVVGGGITGAPLSAVQGEELDFVINHRSNSADGSRTLKSSEYYIRDDSGKLVGIICVNIDITELLVLKDRIDDKVHVTSSGGGHGEKGAGEALALSMDEMLDWIFDATQNEMGVADPKLLCTEEKKEFVARLAEKNLFMLKGAVSKVSSRLAISDPTVYRYLRGTHNAG